MKLVVITVSNVALTEMIRAADEIKKVWSSSFILKLYFAGKNFPVEKLEGLENSIRAADMVILDLMGAAAELQEFILKTCKISEGHIVPIGGENSGIRSLLRLGSLTADDMGGGGMKPDKKMNPEAMQKMKDMAGKSEKAMPSGKQKDMRNYVSIGKYWRSAGKNDIKNLLFLLLSEYGGVKGIPEPQEPAIVEETVICRPSDMRYYESFEKFVQENAFDKDKPIVALLYYGHSYPNRTSGCVAEITDKISDFANVLPIAFATATGRNQERLKQILNEAAGRKADLVINFMSFRLGAGPMGGDAETAVNMLRDLNVPVLHPFFMSKREELEWKNSSQGTSPSEFLISVMLPELDGCIETFPIGAMGKASRNEAYDIEVSELTLIEDRAEKLAKRVRNWLKLQSKSAKDKKVAIK